MGAETLDPLGVVYGGDAGLLDERSDARMRDLDQFVMASRVPSGSTSQPRRQPVIIQALEKLLQTMTRSSGSATSSSEGAAGAPS